MKQVEWTDYEQARHDFGTSTIMQDWPSALEALGRMAKHRPTDDVAPYLAEQVKTVKARLAREKVFLWKWPRRKPADAMEAANG